MPVRLFPRWLRCSDTRCNRLAPVESRLFDLLTDPWRPERIRYVHGCRGHGYNRPTAVPARFVLACERGHLDDFPWLYYVHGGTEPAGGEHTLRLSERGTTGEAANLFVECSCDKSRPMAQALGREAFKALPGCRGRHPHLGTFEECGVETRTLGLGATNGWFAMQIRAFSLPLADTEVDQRVAENWPQLNLLVSLPQAPAKALLPSLACWPDVEPYGADAVWEAILRRAEQEDNADDGPADIDLKGPECRGLSFAGASIRESGLPVSDREAVFSHPGNGPVFVVYSRSVGDGGQRSCTQSASPVRRASCSGSIVRPQALQFCLDVGKVIFNRQPVTFVAAGCASDLVPMRSSLAEA